MFHAGAGFQSQRLYPLHRFAFRRWPVDNAMRAPAGSWLELAEQGALKAFRLDTRSPHFVDGFARRAADEGSFGSKRVGSAEQVAANATPVAALADASGIGLAHGYLQKVCRPTTAIMGSPHGSALRSCAQ